MDHSLVPYSLASLQIWVPSNPRGAERLPPGIVEAESDFYLRRLWGKPSEVCILKQFIGSLWPQFLISLENCFFSSLIFYHF